MGDKSDNSHGHSQSQFFLGFENLSIPRGNILSQILSRNPITTRPLHCFSDMSFVGFELTYAESVEITAKLSDS